MAKIKNNPGCNSNPDCGCGLCGIIYGAPDPFFVDGDLASNWEIVTGSVIEGDADYLGRSVGSFELRNTDPTEWPQTSSCRWEAEFYPEASGNSFSIFAGWSEHERWEARLTAIDGTPMLELYQWADSTPTLIRRKVNYDSTFVATDFTSIGLKLRASLCHGALLITAPAISNYDGVGPADPYLLIHVYEYRLLQLSSGGGGPGANVRFQSGRWGLGGSGNFQFDVREVFNTRDNLDDPCPPDESCRRLLTELPIAIDYSVRGVENGDYAQVCIDNGPGTRYCFCETMNGSFEMVYEPASPGTGRCFYETYPVDPEAGCDVPYDCFTCGSGDPGSDDFFITKCVVGQGGFGSIPSAETFPFQIAHGGGGNASIEWDLEVTDSEGVTDIAGEPDSLGCRKPYWTPAEVDYDKWHYVSSGGPTPINDDCKLYDPDNQTSAQMRIDQFVFGASEDAP